MMKFFWKYVFPAIYGLMVYFTIRLLTDSVSGMKFWHRSILLNSIEIAGCILTSYLFIWLMNRLLDYYDKKWPHDFSYKRIIRELLGVFLLNLVVHNALVTPLVAFTDNGLQWFDLVDINLIPLLYALIYYGVKRSNAHLKAYIENRLQLEKITNDKLHTELKFLKAQYHPHFLFNALNTIYFQMDEDVSAAKKTVEKFAELLRYQLYNQQDKVSISNEIQYLRNFIDLQKIRTSSKLNISVHFDEQLHSDQVYPLLFLPLVENAFKYIGGNFQINLQLMKKNGGIHFFIENSLPEVPVGVPDKAGIGLENLQRRLELLYPGKHTFSTGVQHNRFIADLKLTLHE